MSILKLVNLGSYEMGKECIAAKGTHNRIFSKNGPFIGDYAWHRNASNPKVVCLGDLK